MNPETGLPPFRISRLGGEEGSDYRALRLEGLREHPEAFGASWEEEASQDAARFSMRLERGLVFGARSGTNGTLVGIIGLRVPTEEKMRHKASLWGFYVRRDARRTGVGRALLDHAIAYAAAVVEEVTLIVEAQNAPALALYRQIGFEQYGLEKRSLKIGDVYHDEVLMALPLG
ncbi:GNAT family N-acetyltransferase [Ciceribacter sp. L1K22]|uniref:GNAT family N-acetyltransferase n=1 Tax=Ciceribacter sp. L1K22 TaxID=2820275 RepID=UPI001ABE2D61|nr:GNAT family N-acetyltransferase [Ciceribacter sp. L1K22]MBO3759462.1 GNAT family N-acetyltransferase [Ciceribacter sp. L1K22]